MKVGIIGCGNISQVYLENAALFPEFEITHLADLNPLLPQARAAKYGGTACSVEALLASDIDTVLNLTVPNAHAEVALAAIAAGKHVYTEKPLAISRTEARQMLAAAAEAGVTLASAPDTVLGPGVSVARQLVGAGMIGRPIAGRATMMTRGMMAWHPNPDFFFKPGGGPVLDMGPYYVAMMCRLLGPVARVTAMGTIGIAERVIEAPDAPRLGQAIKVETLTTVQGVLGFVSGAQVQFSFSWDVWQHDARPLELYGEAGGLRLPDPNYFGGVVEIARADGAWEQIDTSALPYGKPNYPRGANYRGLGLQDMAQALAAGRAPACSGAMGYHVLDVLLGIEEAALDGKVKEMEAVTGIDTPWTGRPGVPA